MSDDWLYLIPSDPHFAPSAEAADLAREHVARLTPDADAVKATVTDEVAFVSALGNMETVSCPRCGSIIDMDWAVDTLGERGEAGFTDLDVTVPCRGATISLNDLRWDWPQGFACFVIEAMNPNISELPTSELDRVSQLVGSPLRVIWAHL